MHLRCLEPLKNPIMLDENSSTRTRKRVVILERVRLRKTHQRTRGKLFPENAEFRSGRSQVFLLRGRRPRNKSFQHVVTSTFAPGRDFHVKRGSLCLLECTSSTFMRNKEEISALAHVYEQETRPPLSGRSPLFIPAYVTQLASKK